MRFCRRYLRILKEKLYDYVVGVKRAIQADVQRVARRGASATAVDFASDTYFKKKLDVQGDIGRKLDYFMATGNLVSNSGLDLLQISGYTVVAEKLNVMRYLSHFRSVHRGAFFSEMKTTTVSQLLPSPCALQLRAAGWYRFMFVPNIGEPLLWWEIGAKIASRIVGISVLRSHARWSTLRTVGPPDVWLRGSVRTRTKQGGGSHTR